jgi:hypothetical protein
VNHPQIERGGSERRIASSAAICARHERGRGHSLWQRSVFLLIDSPVERRKSSESADAPIDHQRSDIVSHRRDRFGTLRLASFLPFGSPETTLS